MRPAFLIVAALVAALFLALPLRLEAAHTEVRVLNVPVAGVQARAAAAGKLAPNVRMFYGDEPYPAGAVLISPARMKRSFMTRADDIQRCELLYTYIMSAFTRYARDVGGDAVVNVRSIVKGQEISSPSTFACDVQFRVITVELVASVVKLP